MPLIWSAEEHSIRLLKQERETGIIEPQTHMRGRKPSYSDDDLAAIKNLLTKTGE